MGFHIPDSPRAGRRSLAMSETHSVSVGTSMASEDVGAPASPPPPTPTPLSVPTFTHRTRRRNAMIPILAAETLTRGTPEGNAPMDGRQALLQFQAQLRERGLMPQADQPPKANTRVADPDQSAPTHRHRKARESVLPDRRVAHTEGQMSASGNNGGLQHGQATGRLPVTPADRLERLMKRQKLPKEHTAKLLGCDVEQLNAYLSPENRQATAVIAQRATYESSEMEKSVVKLLMRQEIAEAASIVKRTAATLLAPTALAMRRAHAIPQLARYMTDRRSVFQPASSSSVSDNSLGDGQYANNRKRKRRATVKALADFKTPPRLKPSADLLCPIRIDVDAEGVRYQDTLLINSAVPGNSPEEIAARIAQDERLGDIVKGAIAESIKRQLMAFASFVDSSSESLHPIHLDLFIDGIALRDQFEWDIYNDLNDAESFAATLCADMNLPAPFEPAIAFSIREQVYAYRRILYSKRWIGNDPLAQRAAGQTQMAVTPRPLGISTLEPLEKTVVRDPSEAVLWQPVLSELGKDELQYLKTKIAAQRRSMTTKKPAVVPPANGAHHNGGNRALKRSAPKTQKRPINPFIVYCQVQKDLVSHPKQRRSAAESRKILGDMWRKCTDEEKEYYAQLCEVENEKRRREHVFELRDRAIAEWEEDEARRVGLLGAGVLDVTTETVRELLFLGYMDERHDVDTHWHAAQELEDEGDDDDHEEGHGEEEDDE